MQPLSLSELIRQIHQRAHPEGEGHEGARELLDGYRESADRSFSSYVTDPQDELEQSVLLSGRVEDSTFQRTKSRLDLPELQEAPEETVVVSAPAEDSVTALLEEISDDDEQELEDSPDEIVKPPEGGVDLESLLDKAERTYDAQQQDSPAPEQEDLLETLASQPEAAVASVPPAIAAQADPQQLGGLLDALNAEEGESAEPEPEPDLEPEPAVEPETVEPETVEPEPEPETVEPEPETVEPEADEPEPEPESVEPEPEPEPVVEQEAVEPEPPAPAEKVDGLDSLLAELDGVTSPEPTQTEAEPEPEAAPAPEEPADADVAPEPERPQPEAEPGGDADLEGLLSELGVAAEQEQPPEPAPGAQQPDEQQVDDDLENLLTELGGEAQPAEPTPAASEAPQPEPEQAETTDELEGLLAELGADTAEPEPATVDATPQPAPEPEQAATTDELEGLLAELGAGADVAGPATDDIDAAAVEQPAPPEPAADRDPLDGLLDELAGEPAAAPEPEQPQAPAPDETDQEGAELNGLLAELAGETAPGTETEAELDGMLEEVSPPPSTEEAELGDLLAELGGEPQEAADDGPSEAPTNDPDADPMDSWLNGIGAPPASDIEPETEDPEEKEDLATAAFMETVPMPEPVAGEPEAEAGEPGAEANDLDQQSQEGDQAEPAAPTESAEQSTSELDTLLTELGPEGAEQANSSATEAEDAGAEGLDQLLNDLMEPDQPEAPAAAEAAVEDQGEQLIDQQTDVDTLLADLFEEQPQAASSPTVESEDELPTIVDVSLESFREQDRLEKLAEDMEQLADEPPRASNPTEFSGSTKTGTYDERAASFRDKLQDSGKQRRRRKTKGSVQPGDPPYTYDAAEEAFLAKVRGAEMPPPDANPEPAPRSEGSAQQIDKPAVQDKDSLSPPQPAKQASAQGGAALLKELTSLGKKQKGGFLRTLFKRRH